MFQKRRLGIVLALLSSIVLTFTGCSNSPANKAADNAKAFADEKNFEQAAQTLHSAESELGSNLGPKELKVLANAYSYIAIKITENAESEAEKGNFEKAYQDINYSYAVLNLPPTMSLSEEAIEAAHSARREIAKKCLKAALDVKFLDSVELFNIASTGTNVSITPEIQKIFDDTRIKISEGPVISIIELFEGKHNVTLEVAIDEAEEIIRVIDSIDTSVSSVQSDNLIKARDIFLEKKTQADIDRRLTEAEQSLEEKSKWLVEQTARNVRNAITILYDDPAYRKYITKEQTQRYNAVAHSLNTLLDKAEEFWSVAPGTLNPLKIPALDLPSQ